MTPERIIKEGLAHTSGSLPSQNPVVSLPVELQANLSLSKLWFVHWINETFSGSLEDAPEGQGELETCIG